MTLLSRSAEHVYWAGRYLERAEATARVLKSHTSLYLDLPRSAGLTWEPLLGLTGDPRGFFELYPSTAEEFVVGYLSIDRRNPGSVLASLASARENMRIARSIFPRDAWEKLNRVFNHAADNAGEAVPRLSRTTWLNHIIDCCQTLQGIIGASMAHDEAYRFLCIGCHLERADMTSRVLDIRAGAPAHVRSEPTVDQMRPFADLQWMSVLGTLAALQAYRRKVQSRVQGPAVLEFVLRDEHFPRSVAHCLNEISDDLGCLAERPEVIVACGAAQQVVEDARVRALAWDGLHEWVDELQTMLDAVHRRIEGAYFRSDVPKAPLLQATA